MAISDKTGFLSPWLVLFTLLPLFFSAQRNPPVVPKRSESDQNIRFLQSKVAQDPDDYLNYNRLGAAYIQKARESGDITYYDLAEKALNKSLELDSAQEDSAPTLVQLATVHFSEHNFSQALVEAQKAIALEPKILTGYVSIGDAHMEIGDYDQAQMAYGHLDPSNTGFGTAAAYLKSTRLAALNWILGKAPEASAQMEIAAELAPGIQLPAENVAWTHFMLGEQCFQRGDFVKAEAETQSALRIYPGYHRALAEMGKIRTAQGKFSEAITFYAKALSVIPLPLYATSLGDLYARTGNKKEAEKQYALVEYIGVLSKLNKMIYNRELAMFYADHDRHLPAALQLAEKELEARHDVYTWDALAWALSRNGKPQEAADAMKRALRMGTQDALLMYHAGIIQKQLGNDEEGRAYLERALKINPEFHIFYADQARRTLAVLEKRKQTETPTVSKPN